MEENKNHDTIDQDNKADEQESPAPQPRQLRGLYKNVNISVRALDIIIFTCIAVIVLVVIIDLL